MYPTPESTPHLNKTSLNAEAEPYVPESSTIDFDELFLSTDTSFDKSPIDRVGRLETELAEAHLEIHNLRRDVDELETWIREMRDFMAKFSQLSRDASAWGISAPENRSIEDGYQQFWASDALGNDMNHTTDISEYGVEGQGLSVQDFDFTNQGADIWNQ